MFLSVAYPTLAATKSKALAQMIALAVGSAVLFDTRQMACWLCSAKTCSVVQSTGSKSDIHLDSTRNNSAP